MKTRAARHSKNRANVRMLQSVQGIFARILMVATATPITIITASEIHGIAAVESAECSVCVYGRRTHRTE